MNLTELVLFGFLGGASEAAAPVVAPPEAPPAAAAPPRLGGVVVDDDTMRAVAAAWEAAGGLEALPAVDDDTLRAVLLLFGSDDVFLPTLIPGGLIAGRVRSGQATPYATLSCRLERRELAGTGGAWHDYRRVEIKVYGLESQAVDGANAVLAIFNRSTTLSYPSGARFMRWMPDGEVKLSEVEGPPEQTTVAGQPLWVAELSAVVWSIRER